MASPEFSPSGIVTLASDFDQTDYYVAAMKGEMLKVSSELRLVDAIHQVPAQDVETASFLLANYAYNFPDGTVHLMVVDPEVGSARAALVVSCRGHLFVCPDNGLITMVLFGKDYTCRGIDPVNLGISSLGSTFHGRDLFAPAAAMLAAGRISPDEVGDPHEPLILKPLVPTIMDRIVEGCVVHVDSFGNLVTNVPSASFRAAETLQVQIAGRVIDGIVPFYSAAAGGSLVALIGSGNALEISIVNGDASAVLGVGRGQTFSMILETG